MTLNCTNQFKLLEPHVCSYDPNFPPPPLPEPRILSANPLAANAQLPVNGSTEPSLKRKASAHTPVDDHHKEKRARIAFKGTVDEQIPPIVEGKSLSRFRTQPSAVANMLSS